MIYEPENLKNKRAIYEKRDKWLIRLAFLFWAVLLLIYVNIVIPYVKSTIGVKAKLFCPEIAGLFCRIAGLFCHDSRANLSLKPVCFGIAIS